MYDDYDLDYTFTSDYASSYDLDEMCEGHVSSYNMIQDSTSYDEITSCDDDEYRDEQDYQAALHTCTTHDRIVRESPNYNDRTETHNPCYPRHRMLR